MLKSMWRNKIVKIIFLAVLMAIIVTPLIFIKLGQTKIQPYYSGDAINYNNQLIVATANTGNLEVFRLSGKNLERLVKVKIYNQAYNTYEDYSDVKLSVENGNLYVYAVSQYTVFKYDFSDLSRLTLITKDKNTYWNWYYRIDRFGDNFGLVGKKGVDILNANFQIINSYNFTPTEKYGLRSNNSNQFLFGITDGQIQIYDREQRTTIKNIPLNFSSSETHHKVYFDSVDSSLYAIDDYYAKKFSLDGQLLASYRHADSAGFDAESTYGNPAIYFSNGLGVIKLDKENFKLTDYVYTTNLGAPQGWAMGLQLVTVAGQDRLVLFNATSILVLNDNLKLLASVQAEEVSETPIAHEALYLNYDHGLGTPGATIKLNGGGYWSNENVKIRMGEAILATVPTDRNGRFETNLILPNLRPQRIDFKVDGVDSGLTYSISFQIN